MKQDQAILRGNEWVHFLDGKEVTQEEYEKRYPPPSNEGIIGGQGTGWPMVSEMAAVHPDQIKEATEHAKAAGVPTDFDTEGRPIFRDRDHRKRYCRAYGFIDRDAGYGDATKGDSKGRFDRPIDPQEYDIPMGPTITRRQR